MKIKDKQVITAESITELDNYKEIVDKLLDQVREDHIAITGNDELVACINTFIYKYRDGNIVQLEENLDATELAYGLGELYAQQIRKVYGWKYTKISFEDDDQAWFAVLSEDEHFAILIHNYMYNLLVDRSRSVNVMLLFNLLEPSSLPPPVENRCTILS